MDTTDTFIQADIPVQPVEDPLLEESGIRLSVLRLDLLHPVISGNKWFKLKHNLAAARRQGKNTILSFGGPWSNHLHALSVAGKNLGFKTIGVVRGTLPEPLTACLADARNAGMELVGVSRADYREKTTSAFITRLRERYGDFYLVPEGGANLEGVQGCAEIPALYQDNSRQENFDLVCMACGTGTMLTGLSLTSQVPLLGVQVLKGEGYLAREVESALNRYQLKASCPWHIVDDWHLGGYAKVSPELMVFLTEFEQSHGIPLEPVYSGKLMYGLFTAIKKRDFIPQNSSILVIHGGGLQGLRGYI